MGIKIFFDSSIFSWSIKGDETNRILFAAHWMKMIGDVVCLRSLMTAYAKKH